MPAPHPREFRQRAVELAREGVKPVARIAKDLGISESCLRNWMAQADDNGSAVKLTSTEKKELAELRRKNRQLELVRSSSVPRLISPGRGDRGSRPSAATARPTRRASGTSSAVRR